jgi:hypothetical protein
MRRGFQATRGNVVPSFKSSQQKAGLVSGGICSLNRVFKSQHRVLRPWLHDSGIGLSSDFQHGSKYEIIITFHKHLSEIDYTEP